MGNSLSTADYGDAALDHTGQIIEVTEKQTLRLAAACTCGWVGAHKWTPDSTDGRGGEDLEDKILLVWETEHAIPTLTKADERDLDYGTRLRIMAANYDQIATGLDDERGRALLTEAADRCRAIATLYAADPTLVDDELTGGDYSRVHPFAVAVEIARNVTWWATREPATEADRHDLVSDWVTSLAGWEERARSAASPDWADPDVSRSLSHRRLTLVARRIATDASQSRHALDSALSLPTPDPDAQRLADLLDQVHELANAVTTR